MISIKHHLRRRQRGIALMLVITLMGLASIMALAILTSASLQRQIQSNSSQGVDAQYLAESGANLAIYYLQNPDKAPTLSNGHYPGQNGVTLGSGIEGSIDITVVNIGGDTYDITSIGYSDTAKQVSRTLKARVHVAASYQVKHAASFRGDYQVPAIMTITGDVRSDGVLTRQLGSLVSGLVAAIGSNVTGFIASPNFPASAAPALGELNLYKTLTAPTPYYEYVDGAGVVRQGTPQLLPATATGVVTPNASNPKNVWYRNGNVTLNNCTMDGTIVLCGSNRRLRIEGNSTVSAHDGMPAVIISGPLQYAATIFPKSLTVNGLCWVGGNINAAAGVALLCTLDINGAFMTDGARVDLDLTGVINVKYVAKNVQIPDLTDVDRTPTGVKILKWGM